MDSPATAAHALTTMFLDFVARDVALETSYDGPPLDARGHVDSGVARSGSMRPGDAALHAATSRRCCVCVVVHALTAVHDDSAPAVLTVHSTPAGVALLSPHATPASPGEASHDVFGADTRSVVIHEVPTTAAPRSALRSRVAPPSPLQLARGGASRSMCSPVNAAFSSTASPRKQTHEAMSAKLLVAQLRALARSLRRVFAELARRAWRHSDAATLLARAQLADQQQLRVASTALLDGSSLSAFQWRAWPTPDRTATASMNAQPLVLVHIHSDSAVTQREVVLTLSAWLAGAVVIPLSPHDVRVDSTRALAALYAAMRPQVIAADSGSVNMQRLRDAVRYAAGLACKQEHAPAVRHWEPVILDLHQSAARAASSPLRPAPSALLSPPGTVHLRTSMATSTGDATRAAPILLVSPKGRDMRASAFVVASPTEALRTRFMQETFTSMRKKPVTSPQLIKSDALARAQHIVSPGKSAGLLPLLPTTSELGWHDLDVLGHSGPNLADDVLDTVARVHTATDVDTHVQGSECGHSQLVACAVVVPSTRSLHDSCDWTLHSFNHAALSAAQYAVEATWRVCHDDGDGDSSVVVPDGYGPAVDHGTGTPRRAVVPERRVVARRPREVVACLPASGAPAHEGSTVSHAWLPMLITGVVTALRDGCCVAFASQPVPGHDAGAARARFLQQLHRHVGVQRVRIMAGSILMLAQLSVHFGFVETATGKVRLSGSAPSPAASTPPVRVLGSSLPFIGDIVSNIMVYDCVKVPALALAPMGGALHNTVLSGAVPSSSIPLQFLSGPRECLSLSHTWTVPTLEHAQWLGAHAAVDVGVAIRSMLATDSGVLPATLRTSDVIALPGAALPGIQCGLDATERVPTAIGAPAASSFELSALAQLRSDVLALDRDLDDGLLASGRPCLKLLALAPVQTDDDRTAELTASALRAPTGLDARTAPGASWRVASDVRPLLVSVDSKSDGRGRSAHCWVSNAQMRVRVRMPDSEAPPAASGDDFSEVDDGEGLTDAERAVLLGGASASRLHHPSTIPDGKPAMAVAGEAASVRVAAYDATQTASRSPAAPAREVEEQLGGPESLEFAVTCTDNVQSESWVAALLDREL